MMTPALALTIALQCVGPSLAPVAVGIAKHESGLNPLAINHNANGTTDYGIAQINGSNFSWLSVSLHTPVNARTVMDPCLNLQAAMRVLFAKYQGNPPDLVKAAYAADVVAKIPSEPTPEQQIDSTDPPPPPSWDLEAVANWRHQHTPTPEKEVM